MKRSLSSLRLASSASLLNSSARRLSSSSCLLCKSADKRDSSKYLMSRHRHLSYPLRAGRGGCDAARSVSRQGCCVPCERRGKTRTQNSARTGTTPHTLSQHCTHNTRNCTHCHKSHCNSVKPREGREEAVESLLARRRWRRDDSRSYSLRHEVLGSCWDSTATKVKVLHKNTY
ncbi:hypothetical protein E2C01_030684 [Portunus trituberculatus]|uniref:Uncharacterized protein n=1 Tax=Portunus trituberculatus TaxID=210409 RepID=A0A5B7ER30_PORTR|nr:hypothetical protein [Portunus trituberculatus]